MNRRELRKRLEKEGVNESFYSLQGGLPFEQCVLSEEVDGSWSVYYSEKGERTGLQTFTTEDEACSYFLDWILSIPGIRKRYRAK